MAATPIPIKRTFVDASLYFWTQRAQLLTAITIPTLYLVTIWALWSLLDEHLGITASFGMLAIHGLGFSLFAVTCHRLVLVSGPDEYKGHHFKFRIRELKFASWLAAIYVLVLVVDQVPNNLLRHLIQPGGPAVETGLWYWWSYPVAIPSLYLLGRFSLVFPAVATDAKTSLRWSWRTTKGNGWRMLVLVGLVPWVSSMLIWAIWRESATTLESVVLAIVSYGALCFEIFLLSFAYKFITSEQPGTALT